MHVSIASFIGGIHLSELARELDTRGVLGQVLHGDAVVQGEGHPPHPACNPSDRAGTAFRAAACAAFAPAVLHQLDDDRGVRQMALAPPGAVRRLPRGLQLWPPRHAARQIVRGVDRLRPRVVAHPRAGRAHARGNGADRRGHPTDGPALHRQGRSGVPRRPTRSSCRRHLPGNRSCRPVSRRARWWRFRSASGSKSSTPSPSATTRSGCCAWPWCR